MILSMSGLQISETAKQCTSSAFTNFVSTFWISKIEWKNIDEIMWNHYQSCKCQAALLGLKSTYFQTLSLDISTYYQSDNQVWNLVKFKTLKVYSVSI